MTAELSSFALFADAVLTGTLLAAMLPLLGILLALRRQLFLGAAIAQSGGLGIAVALALGLGAEGAGSHAHDPVWPLVFGLVASALTSVFALRALTAGSPTVEERAAFGFLLGGSASLLLVANSPHGSHEVQRLMLSSLLGATRTDTTITAALLVLTAGMGLRYRRTLLLWAIDPSAARAHGLPTARIDLAVGVWIGGALGFSLHSTGLPFTFGCAVLPVLCARELARSLAGTIVLAPVIGAAAFGAAWWLGDRYDLPPGQCVVVVLAVCAAIARLRRRFGWRATAS